MAPSLIRAQSGRTRTKMNTARQRRSLLRIQRAIHHMEHNIRLSFSIFELAKVASLSPYHFSREFKACTGLPPMRYLLELRVAMSKDMLRGTNLMHSVIAYECGFSSESQFCTSFKSVTGVTPGRYRNALLILCLGAITALHILIQISQILDFT